MRPAVFILSLCATVTFATTAEDLDEFFKKHNVKCTTNFGQPSVTDLANGVATEEFCDISTCEVGREYFCGGDCCYHKCEEVNEKHLADPSQSDPCRTLSFDDTGKCTIFNYTASGLFNTKWFFCNHKEEKKLLESTHVMAAGGVVVFSGVLGLGIVFSRRRRRRYANVESVQEIA